MSWKKVLLLAFALVLTVGLVACGAGEAADDALQDAEAIVEDGLRIAIVTSPSGVDDGSFNQNNYKGIEDFIAENPGASVHAVREPEMDNSIAAVEQIVADYDVIVLPGFQFGTITEVAENNPDTKFILVDIFPQGEDGDSVELDNVYAMTFAEQESGFFAGIAAAMQTETGKVAFVGGAAFPPVVNYQFGFESGVNYANANLGTDAEIINLAAYAGTDVRGVDVGGNYVGAFNDEARGKVIAEALLGEGADVLFVAAGGSGTGAFTAVKEAEGAWVIGCDVDQFDQGVDGDRNIVLTSALKVMDLNVYRQLNLINEGTFIGGNFLLQADTDSTGIVTAPGRQQLDPDTLTALTEAFEAVKAGNITPAGNFSDFGPTDFPGL
ncbi:MAG: BMP family ABC transporter substrate-binding protein [Coriobacteriia bacterium]|nr:BMP family ABC transporter substrate-binding protein [Coriobacteriia bacterium]